MHRSLVAGLLAALVFAGCTGTPGSTTTEPAPNASRPSQVVVAVIDSAVNPYHASYHALEPIPESILATLTDSEGRPPMTVELTMTGSWEERRDADKAIWDNIEPGRLVYFAGTRLLAVSFGGNIIDGGSHGTGTTSAVFAANPEAIVVLAQGVGGPDAEAWAATTPWVDILSESYGLYCGQPVLELLPGNSTAKHNLMAWNRGKVPVGAADNTPCPAMNDGTSGPPWVVGVSGDHPAPEGSCREPVSGNFPDFTADFTQELPYGNNLNETSTVSGTSFATPMTAGSFSRALLQVRQAWGHVGGIVNGSLALGPDGMSLNHIGLRDAFNQTAVYFDLSAVCNEPGSVPVNPAAPWIQMGWGHVDGEIGDAAAALILGQAEPAPKDDAAVVYMESVYAYRQQAWNAVV